MRSSILLALVTTPLSTLAAGTVHVSIVQRRSKQIQKRQDAGASFESEISQDSQRLVGYFMEVTAGTPPQTQQVHVDTGSSDTWFIASDNKMPLAPGFHIPPGLTPGTFDYDKSTSTNLSGVLQGEFSTRYGDNSIARGDYFQDILTLGDVSLENMQLGLAHETNTTTGILGLGFRLNEASVLSHKPPFTYPNLLDTMVAQGKIVTQAFSLWLNDRVSSTGSLLFGGVDTAKYHGNLTILKLWPEPGTTQVTEFSVSFTSFSVTTDSGTSEITSSENPAVAALLDSGTTISMLPENIAQAIYETVGAVFLGEANAIVPCSVANLQGTFDFGFGGPNGPIIKVPISQMIRFPPEGTEQDLYPGTTDSACMVGVVPISPGGPIVLGDTFIRSAYIVYDLANEVVGIAETNFNTTEENIIPFPEASAQIPNATTVEDEATPTAVAPGSATYSPSNTLPIFTGSAASAFASNFASATAKGTSSPSTTAATTSSTGTGTSTPKPGAGSSMKPLARDQLVLMGLTTVFLAFGGLLLV